MNENRPTRGGSRFQKVGALVGKNILTFPLRLPQPQTQLRRDWLRLVRLCRDPKTAKLAAETMRRLAESQRACMAVEWLPMLEAEAKERQGARSDLQQKVAGCESGQARDKAAELAGTNPRYVSDAKKLKSEDSETGNQLPVSCEPS